MTTNKNWTKNTDWSASGKLFDQEIKLQDEQKLVLEIALRGNPYDYDKATRSLAMVSSVNKKV